MVGFDDGMVDYAQLVKIYAGVATAGPDSRYSPPVCCGTKIDVRLGLPDPAHVSTSFVERQNLTMRMSMRRFTRLTNGFSKKLQNLGAAVGLHFMHYNFCRLHESLHEQGEPKRTPAMAAGLTDHVWSLAEVIALLRRRPAG